MFNRQNPLWRLILNYLHVIFDLSRGMYNEASCIMHECSLPKGFPWFLASETNNYLAVSIFTCVDFLMSQNTVGNSIEVVEFQSICFIFSNQYRIYAPKKVLIILQSVIKRDPNFYFQTIFSPRFPLNLSSSSIYKSKYPTTHNRIA